MGTKRSFNKYMEMVGLNTDTKVATTNHWCHKGEWPEQVAIIPLYSVGISCILYPVLYSSSLFHCSMPCH